RRDLAVADRVPLGHGRRLDRDGMEVVDHRDLVAAGDHAAPFDAGHDLGESLERPQQRVGVGDRFQRAAESEVVVEQTSRGLEVLRRPRVEVPLDDLRRTGHTITLPVGSSCGDRWYELDPAGAIALRPRSMPERPTLSCSLAPHPKRSTQLYLLTRTFAIGGVSTRRDEGDENEESVSDGVGCSRDSRSDRCRRHGDRGCGAGAPGTAGGLSVRWTEYGKVVFGPSGKVAHVFGAAHGSTSRCYGVCATAWPPLLTTGAPLAGSGVDAKLLGSTKRKDGSLQVT